MQRQSNTSEETHFDDDRVDDDSKSLAPASESMYDAGKRKRIPTQRFADTVSPPIAKKAHKKKVKVSAPDIESEAQHFQFSEDIPAQNRSKKPLPLVFEDDEEVEEDDREDNDDMDEDRSDSGSDSFPDGNYEAPCFEEDPEDDVADDAETGTVQTEVDDFLEGSQLFLKATLKDREQDSAKSLSSRGTTKPSQHTESARTSQPSNGGAMSSQRVEPARTSQLSHGGTMSNTARTSQPSNGRAKSSRQPEVARASQPSNGGAMPSRQTEVARASQPSNGGAMPADGVDSTTKKQAKRPAKQKVVVAPLNEDSDSLDEEDFETECNTIAVIEYESNGLVTKVIGDGHCLFRAASVHLYGTEDHHKIIRQACAIFLSLFPHLFSHLPDYSRLKTKNGKFYNYLVKSVTSKQYADHVDIVALSYIYRRCLKVHKMREDGTFDILPSARTTEFPPLVMVLADEHYTVIHHRGFKDGVLGLPRSAVPGSFEKQVLAEFAFISKFTSQVQAVVVNAPEEIYPSTLTHLYEALPDHPKNLLGLVFTARNFHSFTADHPPLKECTSTWPSMRLTRDHDRSVFKQDIAEIFVESFLRQSVGPDLLDDADSMVIQGWIHALVVLFPTLTESCLNTGSSPPPPAMNPAAAFNTAAPPAVNLAAAANTTVPAINTAAPAQPLAGQHVPPPSLPHSRYAPPSTITWTSPAPPLAGTAPATTIQRSFKPLLTSRPTLSNGRIVHPSTSAPLQPPQLTNAVGDRPIQAPINQQRKSIVADGNVGAVGDPTPQDPRDAVNPFAATITEELLLAKKQQLEHMEKANQIANQTASLAQSSAEATHRYKVEHMCLRHLLSGCANFDPKQFNGVSAEFQSRDPVDAIKQMCFFPAVTVERYGINHPITPLLMDACLRCDFRHVTLEMFAESATSVILWQQNPLRLWDKTFKPPTNEPPARSQDDPFYEQSWGTIKAMMLEYVKFFVFCYGLNVDEHWQLLIAKLDELKNGSDVYLKSELVGYFTDSVTRFCDTARRHYGDVKPKVSTTTVDRQYLDQFSQYVRIFNLPVPSYSISPDNPEALLWVVLANRENLIVLKNRQPPNYVPASRTPKVPKVPKIPKIPVKKAQIQAKITAGGDNGRSSNTTAITTTSNGRRKATYYSQLCEEYLVSLEKNVGDLLNPPISYNGIRICYKTYSHRPCKSPLCRMIHLTLEQAKDVEALKHQGYEASADRLFGRITAPELTEAQALKAFKTHVDAHFAITYTAVELVTYIEANPLFTGGARTTAPSLRLKASLSVPPSPDEIAAARKSHQNKVVEPLPPDWYRLPSKSSKALAELTGENWISGQVPGLRVSDVFTRHHDTRFPRMNKSAVPGSESALYSVSVEVNEFMTQQFPDLTVINDMWWSHLVNLAALQTMDGIPVPDDVASGFSQKPVLMPDEWLKLWVESLSLSMSTAKSKDVVLELLKKYLPNEAVRTGAARPVPLIVQNYKVGDNTPWNWGDRRFVTTDFGEHIDNLPNKCFYLVLAKSLGLDPSQLHHNFILECEDLLELLGQEKPIQSLHETQLRRMIHDAMCDKPQDCNAIRFFTLGGLFKSVRLVVLLPEPNKITVRVMMDRDFLNHNNRFAKTVYMVVNDGHAQLLTHTPQQFGGDLPPGTSPTPEQVDNLLKWIDAIGGSVITSYFVSHDDVFNQSKTIDTSLLHPCVECHLKCLVDPIQTGGALRSPSATVRCDYISDHLTNVDPCPPVFTSPLNTSGKDVSFLEKGNHYPNDNQLLHLTNLPPPYVHWAAKVGLAGGFTASNYDIMFKQRSDQSKDWCQMSVAKLRTHPFDPGILKTACDLLSKLRVDLPEIDRKRVQSGDETEWLKLQSLFMYLVSQSDILLTSLRDVRAAMAVFRRAKLEIDGSLPADEDSIDTLEGLIPKSFNLVLRSIANMGVPLLLLKERPVPLVQVESHKSASLAIKEIIHNACIDASNAGVLVFSKKVQAELNQSGVVNVPLGSVDKKLANGEISGKKRLIFDLRDLNEEIENQAADQHAVTGLETSEALTPSVMKMLRYIVLMWFIFPFCLMVCFKRDFNNAFKLVTYNLAEVPRIAASIPIFDAIMISSVLVFGQTKSPAWFSIFAMAVIAAFTIVACAEPRINGPMPAHADIHVDDTFAVFRLLGDVHRYYSSLHRFLSEKYLGKGSVSDEKLDSEGEMTDYIQAWGYIWDFRRLRWWGPTQATISIPEAKIEKMKKLLEEITVIDLLQRKVKLDYHQRLQGLAVYMSLCSKPLYSVLQRLFPMTASADAVWLVPCEDVDVKWDDYASGIIMLKLLCNDGSYFVDSCTSSILHVLSPREQIDMGIPVVYLGSDATGAGELDGVLSAVNYNDKVWTVAVVTPFMDAIRGHVNFKDEKLIVAIAEFIPIVLMTMEFGHRWSGRLVVSACDNQVVVGVLKNRRSSNRVLQFLMDIIVRMELRYRFQTTSPYINTKANVLNDEISRLYHNLTLSALKEKVEEMHPGLIYVEMNILLQFLCSAVSTNLFSRVLPGEEANSEAHQFALQYEQGRSEQGETKVLNIPRELGSIVEVNAGLAPLSVAAKSRGFVCAALLDKSAGSLSVATQLLNLPKDSEPLLYETPSQLFIASRSGKGVSYCSVLSFNPTYGEKENLEITPKSVLLLIKQLKPLVVVWIKHTATTSQDMAKDWDEVMVTAGFARVIPFCSADQDDGVETVSLQDLGSPQHAHRVLFTYERSDMAAALGVSAPLFKRSPFSNKMKDFLDDTIDPSLIFYGKFHQYQRLDPSTPCIQAGHIMIGSTHGDLQAGQCVQLSGSKKWLIVVCFDGDLVRISEDGRRLSSKCVHRSEIVRQKAQRLTVLSIQGSSSAMLAWNDRVGGIGNRLIFDNRFPSQEAVRSLSSAEVMRMAGWNAGQANLVKDVTSAWPTIESDYLIGSSTPLSLAESLMDRISSRIFAWRQRSQTISIEDPSTLTGGRRRETRSLPFESYLNSRPIEETVAFLKGRSIGSGTHVTYASSVKPWVAYRESNHKSPFCTGPAWEDENDLCKFAAIRMYHDRVGYSTVKVSIYAIRKFHLLSGLPSPLTSRHQLNMVLAGMKRIDGPVQRKVPVSMKLLRSLASRLDLDQWDSLVSVTTIMVMYMFLLRSGEALKTDKKQDLDKVLKVGMIIFKQDGKQVFEDEILLADEMVVCIGKAKADQVGQGKVINAHAVPDDPLCPVALLKLMYRLNPFHFREDHHGRFLFTMRNGNLIDRTRIVRLIRREAVVFGYPPASHSIISIRAGSATAMHAAGFTPEQIKSRGRWLSECWRDYVWTGEDLTRLVSNKLLSSSFTPTTALHYFGVSRDSRV